MRELDTIYIHHTASSPEVDFETVERWHRDRGWSEIGYHRFIDDEGVTWDGRRIQKKGAHAGRAGNRKSIGIAVAGDNTRARRRWREVQWKALIINVRFFLELYGPLKVKGHNEAKATLCPGMSGDELRERIAQVIQ